MLPWMKQRFLLRMELAQKSHLFFKEALQAGNFSVFVEKITPLIQSYQNTYQPPLWWRILSRFKHFVKNIIKYDDLT
jgi:hypothetical protein